MTGATQCKKIRSATDSDTRTNLVKNTAASPLPLLTSCASAPLVVLFAAVLLSLANVINS
jgi:hypothetical protein